MFPVAGARCRRWTRVTPVPEAVPGSGLGPDVRVGWELAEDRAFTRAVASGTTTAGAASDHTVKADVRGLRPATSYWFRFTTGSAISPPAPTWTRSSTSATTCTSTAAASTRRRSTPSGGTSRATRPSRSPTTAPGTATTGRTPTSRRYTRPTRSSPSGTTTSSPTTPGRAGPGTTPRAPKEGLAVNVDQWDGYTDDRGEPLAHLTSRAIRNTVFLTGDIHMAWANDVPVKAATYPLSASAATEFVVTSVTSDNLDDLLRVAPGTVSVVAAGAVKAANRHVKWVDMDHHGYGVLDGTAERSQMDYYTVSDKTDPAATTAWARSYRTRSGTQRVERVYQPVR